MYARIVGQDRSKKKNRSKNRIEWKGIKNKTKKIDGRRHCKARGDDYFTLK